MTTKQPNSMDRRQEPADALRDLIVRIDSIINDIESDRANRLLKGKSDRYCRIPTVQVRLAGDTSTEIDDINRRVRKCGLDDGDILKVEPVPSGGADWFRTYLSIHHPGDKTPLRMIAASREGTISGRTPFSDEDLLTLIEYLGAWRDKAKSQLAKPKVERKGKKAQKREPRAGLRGPTEKQRRAVDFKDRGWTHKEIADEIGTTESGVSGLLRRHKEAMERAQREYGSSGRSIRPLSHYDASPGD